MDPLTAVAGGAALVNAAGQAWNAISTSKMNKRAENFAWRMHAQQRQDHWQDLNYANWYNSPIQQMERLKEGGLNPHLIYGTGTQAAGVSSAGRAANVSSPNFKAPQLDPASVVLQGMQMKQIQSNIARTDAETAAITSRTLEQDWKNTFLTKEMFEVEYKARKTSVESSSLSAKYGAEKANVEADIRALEMDNLNILSGRDVGSNRQVSSNFGKHANQIVDKVTAEIDNTMRRSANLSQQTVNLELDAVIKKWEADFVKSGMSSSMAQQFISNIFKIILLKK